MSNFRNLSDEEISTLGQNNCSAVDWADVMVSERGFDVNKIVDVHFSGHVTIGQNTHSHHAQSGIVISSGISHARIHNSNIGDNVLIENISGHIANYNIGGNCVIHGVGVMECVGRSTFGNGTLVKVLNEGGGREVMIFDNLSSQVAYMLATYRNRPEVIDHIEYLITQYTNNIASEKGFVGSGSVIENCATLRNFKCGESALVSGAQLLENGTLNSSDTATSYVGSGVIARNFIISTSSSVSDFAILENTFVGQGCEIGKQFSAENTLFFANCIAMHGEACSLFAGPYTVTHHKSTLLIASMFSFMNAGSGANQSNHMYRLGAVHQGVFERGCKLASDSYLVLPAHVGCFTTILGKSTKNIDTASLPFSYIIGNESNTYIVPAVNIASIGTYRDVSKWQRRDKRPVANQLDKVSFELFNPLIISAIARGLFTLNELKSASTPNEGVYLYNGAKINVKALEHGIKLYTIALKIFIGERLLAGAQDCTLLNYDFNQWIDLGGAVINEHVVDSAIIGLKNHNSIEEFKQLLKPYNDLDLNVLAMQLKSMLYPELCREDLLKNAKTALSELQNLVLNGASKDFSLQSMVGYGLAGDLELDFKSVRGCIDCDLSVIEFKEWCAKLLSKTPLVG